MLGPQLSGLQVFVGRIALYIKEGIYIHKYPKKE